MSADSSVSESIPQTCHEESTLRAADQLPSSTTAVSGEAAEGAAVEARTHSVPQPTAAIATTNDTAATDEMELQNDAFQDDTRAFEMSLNAALSDANNQHEELYQDQSTFAHSTSPNNQSTDADLGTPTTADTVAPTLTPTEVKHEKPSNQPASAPEPVPDTTAVRRSPRRATPQKTQPVKKATAQNKRASPAAASSNQAFSWNDILRVQNLIERCLQQHLSKNEIVNTLKTQAKIDQSFTAVVWQKLEEQNPAFFKAYALQLQVKEQLTAFNYLVSQQKEMMAKASGNAAFLSFLSNSDARAQQQQRQHMMRTARLHASHLNLGKTPSSSQPGTTYSIGSATFTSSGAFVPPSPLPMPSPIKTDLDTHAFFS